MLALFKLVHKSQMSTHSSLAASEELQHSNTFHIERIKRYRAWYESFITINVSTHFMDGHNNDKIMIIFKIAKGFNTKRSHYNFINKSHGIILSSR